jgi:RHS repeat-associated protein
VDSVTTNYTLDLNAGLTQVLTDGENTYLYGLSRLAQDAVTTEYFLGDALGSVRQMVDQAGAVTLEKSYTPFGEVLSESGSGESVYGYTGEVTDPSGLVFLRARYYLPGSGRFISRDTWMGEFTSWITLHRWIYVNDNPIYYIDPSGHIATPGDSGGTETSADIAYYEQRNRALYCQAGYTLYCSYAENHPVDTAVSISAGLIGAGIAPEMPFLFQGAKSIISAFGWNLLRQCSSSLTCWRILSILTGAGTNCTQANTDVIPDEAFVKIDPIASDISIAKRGLDLSFSRDGRLWLTQFKYAKQFLNVDPATFEQVLYSQAEWQLRKGDFASGATFRLVMIDTAVPAGVTNIVNGIPQWYIISNVPSDLLQVIWRIFP